MPTALTSPKRAVQFTVGIPWKPYAARVSGFPQKIRMRFFKFSLTQFEPPSEFNTSITRPAFETHPAAVLASVLPLSADR